MDESGRWIPVSSSAGGIAVGNGERILYTEESSSAIAWMDREGKRGVFPCEGRVFVPRAGKRRGDVLCVKVQWVNSSYGREGAPAPVPLSMRWMNAEGSPLGPWRNLDLAANPYRSSSERKLIGLLDEEPVIVIENLRETSDADSFPGKECTYFVLDDASPRSIGKSVLVDKHPPYTRAEHVHCDEPEVIREALGPIQLTRVEAGP